MRRPISTTLCDNLRKQRRGIRIHEKPVTYFSSPVLDHINLPIIAATGIIRVAIEKPRLGGVGLHIHDIAASALVRSFNATGGRLYSSGDVQIEQRAREHLVSGLGLI